MNLVLIGFDGTPAAVRAVREAAQLFPGWRALVVTVWEAGRAFDLAMVPTGTLELTSSNVEVRSAAEVDLAMYREAAQLAAWGARLANHSGLAAEGLAVADQVTVADTLVRLTAEHQAAVLVVGAHRHARLTELLLGSTTRAVLQHAMCPTLVVRAEKSSE